MNRVKQGSTKMMWARVHASLAQQAISVPSASLSVRSVHQKNIAMVPPVCHVVTVQNAHALLRTVAMMCRTAITQVSVIMFNVLYGSSKGIDMITRKRKLADIKTWLARIWFPYFFSDFQVRKPCIFLTQSHTRQYKEVNAVLTWACKSCLFFCMYI